MLIANCHIVSPTLTVHPTSSVIPCKKTFFLGGGNRFTTLQLMSLTTWVFIRMSIAYDNISSYVVIIVTYHVGFIQMTIVHDNILSHFAILVTYHIGFHPNVNRP